jgi:excisionase family DNA binding protein
MENKELMTRAEVISYLRISNMTLHRLMKAHGLPYIKLGKRVLFRRADIDKYLEAHFIRGDKSV